MESWWQLGEGFGQLGNDLELYRIQCPFCMESGNFKGVFRASKKKANGRKVLHFDTYECGSCAGYVMVLWSASESSGLYNYRVLPWPMRLDRHPEHWPATVGRFWVQAHRNLRDENWDATTVMARSALQAALRDRGAAGNNLKQEISGLAATGVLPPLMREWSDEVRDLGNDSAHPAAEQPPTAPQDARDIVSFLDFLLEYLYDLPHRIEQYRARTEGQ